ncbi:hypothetical protein R6Q59_029973 [Mikania micrantha]
MDWIRVGLYRCEETMGAELDVLDQFGLRLSVQIAAIHSFVGAFVGVADSHWFAYIRGKSTVYFWYQLANKLKDVCYGIIARMRVMMWLCSRDVNESIRLISDSRSDP